MSGMPHPYTATVMVDGKTLAGCGGDPAALLQGVHWRVQRVGGAPVSKGTQPSMFFDAQGRVTGNSSCNRFFGGYSLSGEGLKIERPAGTMMACEPEVMKQEAAFLQALAALTRFELKDGALVLLAPDGTAIVARR